MCIMSFMKHCFILIFESLFLDVWACQYFSPVQKLPKYIEILLLGCFLIFSYPLLDCIAIHINEKQWLFLSIVEGERTVLEKGLAMQLRMHSILLFFCFIS